MKNVRNIALVTLAVLALGCGKAETPQAAPAAEKKADAAAPAAPVSPAADSIGIPACDAYLTSYSTCLDSKVPEAARGAFRAALDQTREAWKKTAADPNSKAAMETACKQATESAKQALAAYNCTW